MQPTAQALGRKRRPDKAPEGRKNFLSSLTGLLRDQQAGYSLHADHWKFAAECQM